MGNIRKIGLLTSGGDSPGMNAAIRAVVRTALFHGIQPVGIYRGYQGLIEGELKPLSGTDVSNIIQRGGTILKTARSKAFMTPEGMEQAYRHVQEHEVDALVLIGGDGTIRGAVEFFKRYSIPAMALPGTIDNDLRGTDFTIGFDTATNTAIEAIDKIRDTANAHDRLFLVEVMGRDAGYIALYSGLACGAEHIFLPEQRESFEQIVEDIIEDRRRKKLTNILVVAEGDESGGAMQLSRALTERIPELETRVTILGHIQRGGTPTASDRILASRLGHAAVEALRAGRSQEMVGLVDNRITFTPFAQCVKQGNPMQEDMLQMIRVLAR